MTWLLFVGFVAGVGVGLCLGLVVGIVAAGRLTAQAIDAHRSAANYVIQMVTDALKIKLPKTAILTGTAATSSVDKEETADAKMTQQALDILNPPKGDHHA